MIGKTLSIATAMGVGLAAVFAVGGASAQVKIGAVLSASGPASFLGDPEKKTLDIYVQDINAKGGVAGQKLQLVIYDDGGDADAASTFATRLVEEDKVVAVVGGTTTGSTLAMIPISRTHKFHSSHWRAPSKLSSRCANGYSKLRIPTGWLARRFSPTSSDAT